jgi:predicted flap endonuclease-1-like 5' DNA nuclease
MTYLMVQLWFWWLLSVLVGGYVGWTTFSGGRTDWRAGWFPWGIGAFALGLLIAALKLLPTRLGFYLDTLLVLFAAYIVGCLLGGFLKGFRMQASPVALASVAVGGTSAAVLSAAPRAPAPPPIARAPAPAPVPPPPAAPAPVAAAAPLQAPAEENLPGLKPKVLAAPRDGKGDDLKRIRGIGRQNEGRLHALGVWHYDQIGSWTPDEVEWVGGYLAFPGRIEREEWVTQAKILATGADTEFSKRADRGEVATSKDLGDKGQGNVADLSGLGSIKPKH